MNLLKSSYFNFTQDFFEKRIYPPQYKSICNTLNNEKFINPNFDVNKADKKAINLIEFIPSFVKLELETEHLPLASFKYKYFKGFMCHLGSSNNLKDYMVKQLGKSGNKITNRRLKRLESCFNIRYKTFLEDIDEEECQSLISDLRTLIEKRFNQRGDKHSSLANWDFYKKSTYQMIKEGKACLFVIYSNDDPIGISLDYIYQNIFESAISSYNIDYSKYGLGNTIILKKLKWCFENGYAVFNMRYGDYPYKRYWCNNTFDYESHVVYNRKSLIQTIKAFLIKKKNQLLAYVIKNKDKLVLIKKIQSRLAKNNHTEDSLSNNSNSLIYIEIKENDVIKNTSSLLLDIDDEKNEFLRKYVYDFQYVNSARYDSVKVYCWNNKDSIIYGIKSNGKSIYFMLTV